MAEFFKGISSGPSNVKLCVSSRPWVVFDEAFMRLPLLRLQDLTFCDIEAYVLVTFIFIQSIDEGAHFDEPGRSAIQRLKAVWSADNEKWWSRPILQGIEEEEFLAHSSGNTLRTRFGRSCKAWKRRDLRSPICDC